MQYLSNSEEKNINKELIKLSQGSIGKTIKLLENAELYVNIEDNGLSNFMLYSMNQNGMYITRMQNHLKHG